MYFRNVFDCTQIPVQDVKMGNNINILDLDDWVNLFTLKKKEGIIKNCMLKLKIFCDIFWYAAVMANWIEKNLFHCPSMIHYAHYTLCNPVI